MTQTTSDVIVKVWNISDSISSEFFERFFSTADPYSILKKCDNYFLVTIAKDKAPLIVQKLNDWKVGDKTLKACILDKSNEKKVCIWNLSDLLSDAFFNHLFIVLNCMSFTQKYKDHYIIETTKEQAEDIVKKLNKCFVADTVLRASIIGNDDTYSSRKEPSQHISSIFKDLYFKEKNFIIRKAIKVYGKVSKFYNYKTKKCDGSCKGEQSTCFFYHSPSDKRRSLASHVYTSDICTYQAVKPKLCPKGDNCSNSHNIYEQMFHPTNIHTILCPSVEARLCSKLPFCKFCHKETPDTFYTESWSHLLTFGVKNTFKFFVGAINEVIKIASNYDIKICLLSRCEELLDIANKCIADVISTLKMTSVVLDKNRINLEKYQIFLGTPEIVANYQKRILTSNTKGALIIEDVSAILDDSENKLHLLNIFERIKLTNKSCKVNVVFTSRFHDPLLANTLSKLIGVNVVNVNETSQSGIPDVLKTTLVNQPINFPRDPRIRPSNNDLKSQKILPVPPPLDATWTRIRPSNNDLKSQKILPVPPPLDATFNQFIQEKSFASQSIPKRPYISPEDYLPRKSVKFSSQSPVKMDNTPKKSQVPQEMLKFSSYNSVSILKAENKKLLHKEENCSNTSSQSDTCCNSDKKNVKDKIPVKKLPETELHLRNNLGEHYVHYVQERKEILISHESEYDAYKTFPDLHPNYDKYYSEFLKDYMKKHPASNSEDHKALLWKEYWKSKLKIVMDEEWKDQKKKLFHKYQGKLGKEKQESSTNMQIPLTYGEPQKDLPDTSKTPVNDAKTPVNDAKTPVNDAKTPVNDAKTPVNDVKTPINDAKTPVNDDHIKDNEINSNNLKEDLFTVEKGLEVMEQFSSKLGILGPSMLAMVESSKKLGTNTIESLNIFTEEENVTLINMVISKLKSLQQIFPHDEPALVRAVDFLTQLLEYAKNPPIQLFLDIESVAKSTLGSSPGSILKKIIELLTSKKRAEVGKEKINELFLKVCSVQFELQTSSNDD